MAKGVWSLKKRIVTASAVVLLLSAAFMLWQLWPRPVERTLTAYIYDGGEVSGSTSVSMSGTLKRSPLSAERTQTYVGTFEIDCLEKSCREGVQAKISWYSGGYQLVNWFYMGDFHTSDDFLGISGVEIDEQMKDIRILLPDGRLIHASGLTENISTKQGV